MRLVSARPVVSAGILLGAGLGGLAEGIMMQLILQWHDTLSSVHPARDLVALRYNLVWDGCFHLVSWSLVVLGLWRLWRAAGRADVPMSRGVFLSALVLGWGLYTFVEGTIAHEFLGLHHVHPGPNQVAWDMGFLLLGFVQIVATWVYLKARVRRPTLELVKG